MMRRLLVAGAVVVVFAIGAGVAYVLYVRHQGRDIRGTATKEFVPTEVPKPTPKPPGVAWPMYGLDPERLRFANGVALAPPYQRVWTYRARSLVEFPPAVAYGRLYFANNGGVLFAVNAKTGKGMWHFSSHRCQAMSPAVNADTVYATFLNHPPCNATGGGLDGEVVALSASTGKVRWRRRIGPSESSPLVHGGLVYVGDWTGRVYAFAAATGKLRWSFQAGGKVKDGIALSGPRVFFGAYDGHVYALSASTGKLVWKASSQPRLGQSGEFYATPAVAYGRVFIGSTDGKEYAFGAGTGDLLWSHSTGGYVYSSSAVWRKRVYAGSYSGSLYCFDAATGDVKWSFTANGPISGSPTIVAGRVYFATLKQRTYALDARTGHPLWTFPDGKYSPVVVDPKRLYLVGYTRVYGLDERRSVPSSRAVRSHGSSRVHRVAPGRSSKRRGP
jgi:outer membrane protein assembly factor BamB